MFVARNLTFDVQADNVAASAIIAAVDDYLEIANCELEGQLDRIVPPFYSVKPTLLTESGQGVVQLSMQDGSFYDPSMKEQEHPMGLAIERRHRGDLVVENTDIEGFLNTGIYSAGHNGKVAIRNTSVKNCGAGMLRLGDGKRHGLVVDAPWVDVMGCSFTHADGGLALLLENRADYLRLKNCDFKRGQLFQYSRATTEAAIVADNRFADDTELAGEQVNWTTRGPGFE